MIGYDWIGDTFALLNKEESQGSNITSTGKLIDIPNQSFSEKEDS